jgi:hypothetical protein
LYLKSEKVQFRTAQSLSTPILSRFVPGERAQATDPYQGPFLSNLKPTFVSSGVGSVNNLHALKKKEKTKYR